MDFMHLVILLNFYFNYLKIRLFKRPLNEMSALSIFYNIDNALRKQMHFRKKSLMVNN